MIVSKDGHADSFPPYVHAAPAIMNIKDGISRDEISFSSQRNLGCPGDLAIE